MRREVKQPRGARGGRGGRGGRGRGRGGGAPTFEVVEEPRPSFFLFFATLDPDELDEEEMDQMSEMEQDAFDLACLLRFSIVPHAIQWSVPRVSCSVHDAAALSSLLRFVAVVTV